MRIEEMRIETKEHYRVTVLEDRIEELEEDVKVLKEQIDILGSVLYDIVHDAEEHKKGEKGMIFKYGCGRGVFGSNYGMHIKALEEEVTTLRKITQDLRMEIDTLKGKEKGDRSEMRKEEHNKSEKDDAKKFFKKLEIITKVLGRKLRVEEALLLTIFESLEIDGDEKKPEPEKMHEFKKTSECYTCRNFSKVFEKPEDVRKCMSECCCYKKEG